jgi:hypothetical protein
MDELEEMQFGTKLVNEWLSDKNQYFNIEKVGLIFDASDFDSVTKESEYHIENELNAIRGVICGVKHVSGFSYYNQVNSQHENVKYFNEVLVPKLQSEFLGKLSSIDDPFHIKGSIYYYNPSNPISCFALKLLLNPKLSEHIREKYNLDESSFQSIVLGYGHLTTVYDRLYTDAFAESHAKFNENKGDTSDDDDYPKIQELTLQLLKLKLNSENEDQYSEMYYKAHHAFYREFKLDQ